MEKEIKLKLSVGEIDILLTSLAVVANNHPKVKEIWGKTQVKVFKQMASQLGIKNFKELMKIIKDNQLITKDELLKM